MKNFLKLTRGRAGLRWCPELSYRTGVYVPGEPSSIVDNRLSASIKITPSKA